MRDLTGVRLAIGTPHDGWLSGNYCDSLMRTMIWAAKSGVHFRWLPNPCDSHIDRSRSVVCARFMASDSTDLLWIDSDIAWQPQHVESLIRSGHDVCCGCYPKKGDQTAWPMNLEMDADKHPIVHDESLFWLCKDIPTGFMLNRRSAIQKMFDAHQELKCSFGPDQPPEELAQSYALFDAYVDPVGYHTGPRFLSEDFAFCRRWQALGGECWVDPEIDLAHHGDKIWYFGSPFHWYLKQSEMRQCEQASCEKS